MAVTEAFTMDGERVIAPFALTWIERGLNQGREEGAMAFVLFQLEHLFGEVEEAAQARIKSLSMGSLKELGQALIDFKSPEDLNAWLRDHAGDESPADQFIS